MEQDPDFVSLSRQFKATAMELISVLEQVLGDAISFSVAWLLPLFRALKDGVFHERKI